jgi:hypothetical protein
MVLAARNRAATAVTTSADTENMSNTKQESEDTPRMDSIVDNLRAGVKRSRVAAYEEDDDDDDLPPLTAVRR